MVFNAEGIHFTPQDEKIVEPAEQNSFTWNEFHCLQRVVANALEAEFECEFGYFDRTRTMNNSLHTAFQSSSLSGFTTYRLAQMAVCLDRLAELQ